MDERDKTDKGVLFAATLLQLIAAPFMLLTVIGVIATFFAPLAILNSIEAGYFLTKIILLYVSCLGFITIGYLISSGMMIMSEMMVANHRVTNNRKTPKARLYSLLDNLFLVIGMELIVGSILSFLICLTRVYSVREDYALGESHLFLGLMLIAGGIVYILRKYLMNLRWWRT